MVMMAAYRLRRTRMTLLLPTAVAEIVLPDTRETPRRPAVARMVTPVIAETTGDRFVWRLITDRLPRSSQRMTGVVGVDGLLCGGALQLLPGQLIDDDDGAIGATGAGPFEPHEIGAGPLAGRERPFK